MHVILLRLGLRPRPLAGSGNTALHHVIKTGISSTRESILDTLLKAGADVNICNNDGKSPLYLAAQNYQFSFFLVGL